MTATTAKTVKTGRVTKLADVKGVMEYRFVPKDWVAPLPCVMWFEFDPVKHPDEYEKQQADMQARAERLRTFNKTTWDHKVTWFKDGKPFYTVRVDFDPVERPVLVLVGGIA